MSNLVRRLTRNSQGQLVEAGVVEAPAAPAGADGFVGDQPAAAMRPNGSTAPRFRAYRPQVAPPPPSRQFRADPGYAAGGTLAIEGDTIRRAHAIRRAWEDHYSQVTNEVNAWLAGEGLLGADPQAAYRVYQRAGQVTADARAAVVAAKDNVTAAEHQRVDAVNAYLEGTGPLPDGLGVTAAEQKVDALVAVVELVVEGASRARQRWARALQRADWAAALRQAEQLKGSDAHQAAAWLRVKLNPPPTSSADPIGWAGTSEL